MTRIELILLLGTALTLLGTARVFLSDDLIRRVVALNVASGGVMLLLIGFGQRADAETDPIPQALVLTGIVIMVAVTGLALAIARRIEEHENPNPTHSATSDGKIPDHEQGSTE